MKKIHSLNNVANLKINLLDMTGGSPGANVIINAGFFGRTWLSGGYKGSNEFAYRILKSYKDSKKLKNAWILIAPKGTRSLNLEILNKLNLNFPKNYKKIGTTLTAHRNEFQELWKPK